MNHLKTSPVGIDKVVDRIQRSIYPILLTKWKSIDVYGRAYLNESKKGSSIEVYKGSGEYSPILFNEGNKVFFVQGNRPVSKLGTIENDLWAIALVNLDEIRPNTSHRADEEAHSDLINALYSELKIEEVAGLEYGMDNLKKVVEDTLSFEGFNVTDIQPYHVFMVKLSIKYYLEDINC